MAVGAEPVGERRQEPRPRHEVREQEVLDAVEELGVGDLRVVPPGPLPQRGTDPVAQHLSRRRPRFDRDLGIA